MHLSVGKGSDTYMVLEQIAENVINVIDKNPLKEPNSSIKPQNKNYNIQTII